MFLKFFRLSASETAPSRKYFWSLTFSLATSASSSISFRLKRVSAIVPVLLFASCRRRSFVCYSIWNFFFVFFFTISASCKLASKDCELTVSFRSSLLTFPFLNGLSFEAFFWFGELWLPPSVFFSVGVLVVLDVASPSTRFFAAVEI